MIKSPFRKRWSLTFAYRRTNGIGRYARGRGIMSYVFFITGGDM
jgi:hypothetical protein